MYRLAAIIVNFRTADLVSQALSSLARELIRGDDCAVVVDNNSEDHSVDRLKEEVSSRKWEDWVTVVEADTNRGFGAGNNIGIRAVFARYYILLNSDAYIHEGAIAQLLATAESDAQAGVIGPRLEWPDGSPQVSCFRAHSPLSELVSAARTRPVTCLLRRFEVPIPVDERSIEPEWVSFACVLLRGETVRALGGLDEGYFMYFEDADFCRRARDAGWAVRYEPAARTVHLQGGSSPVKADEASLARLPRYWYASRAHYFRKHYGPFGLWVANLCWYAGRSISLAREIVGHKKRHVCDAKWRDIWIHDFQPPG
ncbi:MAG: glycosyltransferase family 2 protein [Gammaproteobacteria bacterium]|nr:glycosyltransferase family 2 protein [Gammaproteobacteria bacterium]